MCKDTQHQEAIQRFLRDTSAREFTFKTDKDSYSRTIMKCSVIDGADFLYMVSFYMAKPDTKSNADCSGIYIRDLDIVIDASYSFSFFVDVGFDRDLIESNFSGSVRERIVELVNNKLVSVTSKAKRADIDRHEFIESYASECALSSFYKGEKERTFTTSYKVENVPVVDLVRICIQPLFMREQYAQKYVAEYANDTNNRLWENSIINERLAALRATPGVHHFRRNIALSLDPSMKTVTIVVDKDGNLIPLKIETECLQRMNGGTDYSLYFLDAPSRAFEALFVRKWDAKLNPSDIVTITHGKKVLYERDKVVS